MWHYVTGSMEVKMLLLLFVVCNMVFSKHLFKNSTQSLISLFTTKITQTNTTNVVRNELVNASFLRGNKLIPSIKSVEKLKINFIQKIQAPRIELDHNRTVVPTGANSMKTVTSIGKIEHKRQQQNFSEHKTEGTVSLDVPDKIHHIDRRQVKNPIKADVSNERFDWLATEKPRKHIPPVNNNHQIRLFEWRWHDIGIFVVFASFVVAAGIAKTAFHKSHFLLTHVPESCVMIIMGVIVGSILYASGVDTNVNAQVPNVPPTTWQPEDPHNQHQQYATSTSNFPTLTPRLFFNILIPPVILEAAYMFYDRAALSNIYPILLQSILGKFINVLTLGALLLLVERQGLMGSLQKYGEPLVANYSLTMPDIMMFSSVASGVDAAAVLHIFEENNVNKDLFFVMLGESLINDAVTVTMSEYTVVLAAKKTFENHEYANVILFLIILSLGGFVFGVLGGLISALVTRVTYHCSEVEPLALLGLAYMTYVMAELIQLSGHISILSCGLVQAHYAFKNISHSSYITVKAVTKMISSTSESVIFLFLGVVLVNKHHIWSTEFFCWSVFLSIVVRLVVVVLLSELHGLWGGQRLMFKDQLVLSYCGIRGAVCFCLAQGADPTQVPPRQLFITTLLALILFSTFLQGGTVKYLIDLLKVDRSHWDHEKNVVAELHDQMFSMATSAVENIIGTHPHSDFPIYKLMHRLDEKYLMKIFVRENSYSSKYFNEFSNRHYLAILQHQLFLAVKDAQKDKKNSIILQALPNVLTHLSQKLGPQMMPIMTNTFVVDQTRNNYDTGTNLHHFNVPRNGFIHREEPNMVLEEVGHHDISDEPEHFIKEFNEPCTPPPVYRDLKPNRPPSLIVRAIDFVTKPTTNVANQNNDAMEYISENINEDKIQKVNSVPSKEDIGKIPQSSDSQYSETFIITESSSMEDVGSEPRDIPNEHSEPIEIPNSQETNSQLNTPPILPSINVITPSPNTTSRFPFLGRRRSSVIPLFQPNQKEMSASSKFRMRRDSKQQDKDAKEKDDTLNTTADNLRRAVQNSAYRRSQYPAPHHDVEEDYNRVTEAELARRLSAIDNELQLVADVVSHSQVAIAQLRSGDQFRDFPLSPLASGKSGDNSARSITPPSSKQTNPPPHERSPRYRTTTTTTSATEETPLRHYALITQDDLHRATSYSSPTPHYVPTGTINFMSNSGDPPPHWRLSMSPDFHHTRHYHSADEAYVPHAYLPVAGDILSNPRWNPARNLSYPLQNLPRNYYYYQATSDQPPMRITNNLPRDMNHQVSTRINLAPTIYDTSPQRNSRPAIQNQSTPRSNVRQLLAANKPNNPRPREKNRRNTTNNQRPPWR